MVDLIELGFLKKTIVETIISTYSPDGKPNAAPMGVETWDKRHILVRPYTSSLTYKNLRSKGCAVINITSNPELYYRTAFKGSDVGCKVPLEWFEKAEAVDAPRLRMADGFIEVSVIGEKELGPGRREILCNVKLVKALNKPPTAYCRAAFATIEAIIHATRVELLIASGKERPAQKLIKLIRYYDGVVDRIAPDSNYSKIMKNLIQMVNAWRRGIEGLCQNAGEASPGNNRSKR